MSEDWEAKYKVRRAECFTHLFFAAHVGGRRSDRGAARVDLTREKLCKLQEKELECDELREELEEFQAKHSSFDEPSSRTVVPGRPRARKWSKC